jgi:HAD superfamily hydrolase (TIGR01509 family)
MPTRPSATSAAPATPLRAGAIAFDMDGVLIDSAPVIENAWRTVARRHGRTLTDDDIRRYVHGRPGRYTVESLFPGHSPMFKERIGRRVDELEERSQCDPIPGVVPLIRHLRACRVPLALVTSSWPARIGFVLDMLGLAGSFAAVIDRTMTPNGKPHPDPYLAASAALDVPTGDLLVFEDSRSGIDSATAAGAQCVAIGDSAAPLPPAIATVYDFMGLGITVSGGDPMLHGLDRHVLLRARHADRETR